MAHAPDAGEAGSGNPGPTPAAQPTAGELVLAARAGHQEAWNLLVERYLPLVTALARRYRLCDADRDDVEATVWLRLVEHLDQIREPAALPGWIAATTRNESLRVLALRKRTLAVDPQESAALDLRVQDDATVDDLYQEQLNHALRAGLLELPATRRELLMMLLADPPMAYAEISLRLGIPVGSIGPTRARALEQLRHTNALRDLLADADRQPDRR